MKLSKYLKDKLLPISLFFVMYFIILLILFAFKVQTLLICYISIVIFTFNIIFLLISYFRKKSFYDNFLLNIKGLDKSYLVLETINKPKFYEGEILYDSLYEINKSMIENVKNYEFQMNDFREYIEMWIHEVKIPISSLILYAHNHKDIIDKNLVYQMKKIEDYVNQVLYYVRSENAEKDYLIKENKLDKIISDTLLKNKDYLLENNINLIVDNVNYSVLTDSKWIEFILNQIINNSIKYKKNNTDSYIKITAEDLNNKTILIIEDNGIGIPLSDISKVFNKSFTGTNGRIRSKSTGMGLFIAKNLCNKLGHKIYIKSKENEYTKVYITFSKDNYYEVLK